MAVRFGVLSPSDCARVLGLVISHKVVRRIIGRCYRYRGLARHRKGHGLFGFPMRSLNTPTRCICGLDKHRKTLGPLLAASIRSLREDRSHADVKMA